MLLYVYKVSQSLIAVYAYKVSFISLSFYEIFLLFLSLELFTKFVSQNEQLVFIAKKRKKTSNLYLIKIWIVSKQKQKRKRNNCGLTFDWMLLVANDLIFNKIERNFPENYIDIASILILTFDYIISTFIRCDLRFMVLMIFRLIPNDMLRLLLAPSVYMLLSNGNVVNRFVICISVFPKITSQKW